MAREEKAQSEPRSAMAAPISDSDEDGAPEDWPEDLPEYLNDEEELGEYPEEDEEEDDDEYEEALQAEDDVFSLESASKRAVTSARPSAVFPAASAASNRSNSFRARKISGEARKKRATPRAKSNGLKKGSLKRSKEFDMPPTPLGCEWREADGGWSLWRCWSERGQVIGGKYKKERYAGHLSREAWGILKEYDYEAFIAIIGRRFRRHGGR